MDIRPIRPAEDHQNALHRIEALWGADLGTDEVDALDVLVDLVWVSASGRLSWS